MLRKPERVRLGPSIDLQLRNIGRDPPRPALISCAGRSLADKLTHHLTDAVPILHTRAPASTPPLGPGDCRDFLFA
jgi:hypothetical protein